MSLDGDINQFPVVASLHHVPHTELIMKLLQQLSLLSSHLFLFPVIYMKVLIIFLFEN